MAVDQSSATPTPSAPEPSAKPSPRTKLVKPTRDQWVLDPDAGGERVPIAARSINIRIGKPKVKLADIAWMADNLATTQGAGVPLYRALGTLASMRPDTVIGERLLDFQSQMGEGASLGSAMRKYEREFDPLVIALVEAGEVSGSLELSFSRIRDLTKARLRLRRKVRAALIYPVSVLVIATVLVAAILLFVVPRFEDIYASLGGELPLMTQALLAASSYAPAIVGVIALLALAFFVLLNQSRTNRDLRRRIDEVNMRIPLTGSLVRKSVNARIASTIASLLGAGVPLLESLRYAGSTAGNVVYADAIERVRERVTEGASLSEALRRDGHLFPPLFIELSNTGEDTGDLPGLMESYAAASEEEVAQAAESLTSLIEPITIVVIGGVVGTCLIALYLPIIQIGDQIR